MARWLNLFQLIAFYFVTVNVGVNLAISQGILDGVSPSTSDVLRKLVQDFENFKKQLNSIDAQLKTIQKTLQQSTSSDDSKCAVRDVTEAIKGHKFQLAGEKVSQLNDNRKLANIIHDVYLDSPANVDTILEFLKTLKDNEAQLIAYSALREELHATGGNSDPRKVIKLVEDLEREVSRQKNAEFKAKAQTVIDSAIDDIKIASTGILKNAMIIGKYQNNMDIDSLASALSNFRTDVSNEVIDSVVDGVFGVVAAVRILENISSHKDVSQVIAGLKAIFNRFNYAGNLNNAATLHLALQLRNLQRRDTYASLGQELKNEVENVIQQLPTCARNLNFNTNVCIWNKGRAEYLYAASSSISFDPERRSIFTLHSGDAEPGSYWKIQKIGDDFYFKNVEHEDEYMYSVAIDYNKDMRYVFTWIPGNNTDTQSAWAIELEGDYCYIKTTFFNEYMFAPNVKYDKDNNYVFTYKTGTSGKSAEFLWQLRDCGQAQTKAKTSG